MKNLMMIMMVFVVITATYTENDKAISYWLPETAHTWLLFLFLSAADSCTLRTVVDIHVYDFVMPPTHP